MSMYPVSMLKDPRLLGGLECFRDLSTWGAWLVFIRCLYGLPLDAAELELFRGHTGRQEPPRPGGYPEGCAIVGVQSGKTRVAASLAIHAALSGESGTHALLVGQDHRGAMRTLLRNAREPFETLPAFREEVVRETLDLIELRNGVSLSAYPCKPESLRGIRACFVVVDELAFFQSTDGRPVDLEMLRVARGRVATTGGKVVILSSPYAASGALWGLHRAHYGREDSSTLIWQASAPEMNPLLSSDYLTKAAEDPEAFSSEVLGLFRAGLTTLFDPEALQAVVDVGVRERAPEARRYVAFCDSASGSGQDSFAVAVAHTDGETAVLDCLTVRRPPFDPSSAIAEAASTLKRFGLREVVGDRFAPGFLIEGFRGHGIAYKFSEKDRSALYLEFLPMINAGRVLLLDLPELLREMRGLERRSGTSGKDRVDHRSGSHDDQANACAGALTLAAPFQRRSGLRVWSTADNAPLFGTWDGVEYRGGAPWSGVVAPDRDAKGRPTSDRSAIFREGRVIGYTTTPSKPEPDNNEAA